MYYILNQTNQIIAADKNLLYLFNLTHIDELNTQITLKNIVFNITSDSTLTIKTQKQDYCLSIIKTFLSTLLGELTLISVEDQIDLANDNDEINIDSLIIRKNEKQDNIFVDITQISQKIGISKDDFNMFLDEYISTALNLENDLQSNTPAIHTHAINTLLHLTEVLHLHTLTDIIKKIKNSSKETRPVYISSLYDALSRITIVNPTKKLNLEKNTISIKKISMSKEKPLILKNLDLSEVAPITFDFSLQTTVNELSLPENLIKEFMIDFINQVHTETKNMLNAYKNNDIHSIQKIAHLLKGVASNLKITTLSDTLYKIQFCEEKVDLELLIKNYWGHFLAFEKQINLLLH